MGLEEGTGTRRMNAEELYAATDLIDDTTFSFRTNRVKYREKVEGALNSMRKRYLFKDNKYNFTIETEDKEIISVMPINPKDSKDKWDVMIMGTDLKSDARKKLEELSKE